MHLWLGDILNINHLFSIYGVCLCYTFIASNIFELFLLFLYVQIPF